MKKLSLGLLACTALLAATAAQADVITFETDDFAVVFPGDPAHTVQGFNFTLEPGNSDAFLVSGLYAPSDYVNNGTKNLFAANYASVGVAASNGAAFGLNSFELGGSFINSPDNWASSVEVVGHVAGGGTLAANFALPSTPVMTLVTLGWANLSSFEILPNAHAGSTYDDRDFTIDNVNVTTSVPEPGTEALAAAGLAAVGWTARRRRKA